MNNFLKGNGVKNIIDEVKINYFTDMENIDTRVETKLAKKFLILKKFQL